MKRWPLWLSLAVMLGGVAVVVFVVRQVRPIYDRPAAVPEVERANIFDPSRAAHLPKAQPFQLPPPVTAGQQAADRAARADKIRRDYDDITKKISADYAAAGNAFPGGLNAYLRQLALLQREKHADLAAVLTPAELEDLEMRDTNAGQAVVRLLGNTAASDEQRRAVFHLQQAFEDKFALTFDLTPPALLAREAERQAAQQKIRGVLGDDLFGAWLSGEGADYAAFAALAQQQGLAASVPLDLWRTKSDFILARLQLKARADLSAAQLAEADRALASQTLTRVASLIGPAATTDAGRAALAWLPPAPRG